MDAELDAVLEDDSEDEDVEERELRLEELGCADSEGLADEVTYAELDGEDVIDADDVVEEDAEADVNEEGLGSADVDGAALTVGLVERVGSPLAETDVEPDRVCWGDSEGAEEGVGNADILVETDAEFEGLELVDGTEEVVADTDGVPEFDEDGVEDLDDELDCVALDEGVPVRLVVGDPEVVPEPVAVRVDVVVPEADAETVAVRVVVPDAVAECVADVEAVSLDEGVPVRDTVGDPVLVRETDADAVGVEAAEADVVADVVFVAECVSGPLVSVADVV